jgi:hypothetical protein
MATVPVTEDEVISAIKPTRCYLLELPSELRGHILELAVADVMQSTLNQPSIALTCRQLRFEALPVFYG